MQCELPQPKFQWWPCPLLLEMQQQEGGMEYISLKGQANFYAEMDEQYQVESTPELQQDPLYESDTGFNWHKSWLIPSLKIKTNLSSFSLEQEVALKCYVTSCYPAKEFQKNFLREIKLQGQTQKNLTSDPLIFNNLKFTTTSFKISGARLSLLVIIFIQNSGIILKSMISSPIYIDSRKEARLKKTPNAEKIQNCKFNEALFVYQNMQKVRIHNDLEGFIMYYTASNIRFKFKHPFYVCYKFSKCFTLYYNSSIVKQEGEDQTMDRVWDAIDKQQPGTILIQCEYINFQTKKRTLAIFSNWRVSFIQFVFSKEEIPCNYQSIDTKCLPNAYKACSNRKPKTKTKKEKQAPKMHSMTNYYTTEITLSGMVDTAGSELSI